MGLQKNPDYTDALTNGYIKLLTRSAPLHDIGKVGIPDAILRKPGPLTPQEWDIMKTHAQLGSDAIEFAERDAAEPLQFLSLAKEIARWHHEKWDGSGYPDGLIGDGAPISARIMALADVFDALISPRVYKLPMPYEQARDIILKGRGTHFDPDVVDIFMSKFDVFCEIADRYRDTHSDC
ncbi:MAG: HD domain-containing protein [Methylomicrobium sp.]|nr:HD domain-containing protein [Methylomicrobium sp.]